MTRRRIPKTIAIVATATLVCLLQLLWARGRIRFSLVDISSSYSSSSSTSRQQAPTQNVTAVPIAKTSAHARTAEKKIGDGSEEIKVENDDGDSKEASPLEEDDAADDDETESSAGDDSYESEAGISSSSDNDDSYGAPTRQQKKSIEYIETKMEQNNERSNLQNQKMKWPRPPVERKRSVRMVLSHVWSPYVVWPKQDVADDPYYPLDQAQNVTWASMWRAKQYYEQENTDRTLIIYCAVLWMDVEVLQRHQPPLCQEENIIILDRSTHTEYPELEPPIHYPFVNDILLKAGDEMDRYSARRRNTFSTRNKYMIYTNSDIGVVKKFYTTLEKAIVAQPSLHEAFQINRRTIVSEYRRDGQNETHPLTSNDLDLIENTIINNYTYHPGVDCFVTRKDILDGFDLGNLFLGQPPWAGVLKTILRDFMSTGYGEYSSKAGMTYHLGDDREWNEGGQILTNTDKFPPLAPCMFPNSPRNGLWSDHRYQNTLNCAIISNGTENFLKNDGPYPPFLKPNAYDKAMLVYRVRERQRKIEKIKRQNAAHSRREGQKK